jgi:MinD-like ATPase involved in chromosome partitioning or flagellar assembly
MSGKTGKIVAVHSYKGGTGKTLIATNLAAALAKQGQRVCLFDLDIRAPSLLAILQLDNVQHWINDYLNGTCEIGKVLIDLSHRIHSEDKLFVCLANPTTEAIRRVSTLGRKGEKIALRKLMSLKDAPLDEKGFDYLIFDTGPGVQYSSMNAIVAADFILLVTTQDKSDVDGTGRMVRDLYQLFEKKTGLVLNKVLDSTSQSRKNEMRAKVASVYHMPLIGLIPCFCDVLRAEGKLIFVQDKPDHPVTRILEEMARHVEAELG